MSKVINEYYEALGRIVSKGLRPSLDAVAEEAGKPKGSIRRSQRRHLQLVLDIEASQAKWDKKKQSSPTVEYKAKYEKKKVEAEDYKRKCENLLSQNLSYLWKIQELEDKVAHLLEKKRKDGNILQIVKSLPNANQ